MWSPDTPRWRIGLSARRLVRARTRGVWPRREIVCDSVACAPEADGAPWTGAVGALAQWLAGEGARGPSVQVVLSGSFLRWLLLEWRPELTRQHEVAAYAQLRFAETFGKAAAQWQVLHSVLPAGRAAPACAVDAALVQALRKVCNDAGARLELVAPYFGCAADHWRGALGRGTAWFGLLEPDWVSLGLLRDGAWRGLRAQRVEGDWRDVLSGLMGRMGVAAGLVEAPSSVYLAGACEPPAPSATMPFVWLRPGGAAGGAADARRLALGI